MTFLRDRTTAFSESEEQARKQTDHAHDQMNAVLEEIKVLREDVKRKVGDGLNGLSGAAARISGEVISELDQFHTQLHGSYSSLGKDFKSIFDDVTKQMNAQRTEIVALRQQLATANKAALQASHDISNSMQAALYKEREDSKQGRHELLRRITNLLDDVGVEQDQRLAGSLNSTEALIEHARLDQNIADKQQDVVTAIWLQKDEDFTAQVLASRDLLKGKMKKDWTDVNARNAAIQASTKAVHQETVKIVDVQISDMAVQMQALDEFVGRARTQNEHHYQSHMDALQNTAANFHSAVESVESAYQSSLQSLKDAEELSHPNMAGLSEFVAEIRKPLNEMANSTVHLDDYAATGQTPPETRLALPENTAHNSESSASHWAWQDSSQVTSQECIASKSTKPQQAAKSEQGQDTHRCRFAAPVTRSLGFC